MLQKWLVTYTHPPALLSPELHLTGPYPIGAQKSWIPAAVCGSAVPGKWTLCCKGKRKTVHNLHSTQREWEETTKSSWGSREAGTQQLEKNPTPYWSADLLSYLAISGSTTSSICVWQIVLSYFYTRTIFAAILRTGGRLTCGAGAGWTIDQSICVRCLRNFIFTLPYAVLLLRLKDDPAFRRVMCIFD